MRKITDCTIGPYPRPMPEGMFDLMPKVSVTYEDGTTEDLFTFYPDELSFSPDEFKGLTREEAYAIHHKKDVSYLRA